MAREIMLKMDRLDEEIKNNVKQALKLLNDNKIQKEEYYALYWKDEDGHEIGKIKCGDFLVFWIDELGITCSGSTDDEEKKILIDNKLLYTGIKFKPQKNRKIINKKRRTMTKENIEQFALLCAKKVHEHIEENGLEREPRFELLEDSMCLPVLVKGLKGRESYDKIKEKTNQILKGE